MQLTHSRISFNSWIMWYKVIYQLLSLEFFLHCCISTFTSLKDLNTLSHLQVHDQASEWWINQQDYQEHAAVGRSCCYNCLPHTLLGGRRHSPDWCRCTECFFFVFLFCFYFYFLMEKKRATAPPSFIMQNATAIMNVFFCAKKMLLRCNVFHKRPCDSGS